MIRLGRRTLPGILLAAVLASSAAAHAATPPIWRHDLDSDILWYKMTPAGVLVAGLVDATVGIDQIQGTEVWRRDDLAGLAPFDFNLLTGAERALVNAPGTSDNQEGAVLTLDIRSGETEADLSLSGLSRALMILEPPEHDLTLVYAEMGDPNVRAMTGLVLPSGKLAWRSDAFFGEHEPKIASVRGAGAVLASRPPLFDSRDTVILFMCWDSVRRYDLSTGRLIWENDDLHRHPNVRKPSGSREHGVLPDKHPLNDLLEREPGILVDLHCITPDCLAAPGLLPYQTDGLFVGFHGNFMLLGLERGSFRWEFSRPVIPPFPYQMESTPFGLLVAQNRLVMLDPASGRARFKSSLLYGQLRSRVLVDGQTGFALFSKNKKELILREFDLSSGDSRPLTKIEFKKTSIAKYGSRLIKHRELILLITGYEIAAVDRQGTLQYRVEGQPNTDETYVEQRRAAAAGRGIANFLIALLTGNPTSMIPAKETVAEAKAGWSKVVDAGEFLFVMSRVDVKEEIRSGTWSSARFHVPTKHEKGLARGLMKIRKEDGAVVAQIPLGKMSPSFSIDAAGSWVVYEPHPRKLLAYGTGLAEDLEHEAGELINAGRLAEAVERLAEAVRLRKERLGASHHLVASTQLRLGEVAMEAGDYEHARIALTLASETFALLGDEHAHSRAWALSALGRLHHERSRFEEAEALCRKAATLLESYSAQAPFLQAANQVNLARTLQAQGRLEEAAGLVEDSLIEFQNEGGIFRAETALATSLQADILLQQVRTKKAARAYREALEIWSRELGPAHPNVAACHAGLAATHRLEGRYAEAREALDLALAIRRKALGADHPSVAGTFLQQADLARETGDLEHAGELYHQGLAILEGVHGSSHAEIARGLEGLARLLMNRGELLRAEGAARRALEVNRELFGEHHPATARCLELLGRILSQLGRGREAASLYAEALESAERSLPENHPSKAVMSLHLAEAMLSARAGDRDLSGAAARIDRAERILRALKILPGEIIRGRILRAELARAGGDLDRAITLLSRALEDVEDLRPELGGAEEATAFLYSKFSDAFDRLVEWNLEAGRVEDALEAVERSRARALQVQLKGGAEDLIDSLPRDVRDEMSLREEGARVRLAEVRARMSRLAGRTELDREERRRAADDLTRELAAAEASYQEVYDEIRLASPAYRRRVASAGPERLSVRSLRQALHDGEWLLSYKIGVTRSYLFVFAPGDEEPRVVPLEVPPHPDGGPSLAPVPLTRRALDALILGTAAGPGLAALLESPETAESARPELALLARLLLPGSLHEDLRTARQALVIPDGSLNLLPLEALVLGAGPDGSPLYLLDEGPVLRYAPSLASLEILEGRGGGLARRQDGEAVLASVADPLFDPRGGLKAAQTRRFLEMGGSLPRLPGTALESKKVVEAFEESLGRGSAVSLRGPDADEDAVRRILPGRHYVHVATHGLVDEGRHYLFAALALTPPDDEVTDSENDGLLQLYEIYGLDLRGCRLAVLSACRTNRGRRVEGEGIFGLSRGFLAAGARRVVAAQWAIADKSSASLVGGLFERIARAESRGDEIDYARLLRNAKRDIRNTEKWSSPFYWAPLIMIGAR